MITPAAVADKGVSQQRWILASPILIVLVGHFAARLFVDLLGQWAWVGAFFVIGESC